MNKIYEILQFPNGNVRKIKSNERVLVWVDNLGYTNIISIPDEDKYEDILAFVQNVIINSNCQFIKAIVDYNNKNITYDVLNYVRN